MREAQDWVHAVAAAHMASADTWADHGVAVHRIRGGANNALYRVEVDGQPYALKLCVADERRRAAREYAALRLLQSEGLDIAPTPLWLDESCALFTHPAVAYQWLPGASFHPPFAAREIESLLDSVHLMHTLQPGDSGHAGLLDTGFHGFDFEPYLTDMRGMLDQYRPWLIESDPEGQSLRDRLVRQFDRCAEVVAVATVSPQRDRVPLRLCRADPNRANAIRGEDGRLRWVDWEYSGWGDPALEIADMRWHASCDDLSEEQHAWLRASYRRPPDDAAFDARLAVWDRILVTRWAILISRWLWTGHHGPDRIRLTRPVVDVVEMRARLIRFVERAENFGCL